MNVQTIEELARTLYDCELAGRARDPLTDTYPDLVPEQAYAVQEAYATMKRSAGARLVGRKIGATSKAIQELFDVHTPDFGQLFDDMEVPAGGAIRAGAMIAPMVEPELDFVLERELAGPGITRDDVFAATARVQPCLEIIDSRIDGWRIQYADTVADNGSSARFVVGTGPGLPREYWPHLDEVVAQLSCDGEPAGEATGAAVLGHPADAVAWLANVLGDLGASLLAGDHVLSGSFMAAVPARAGQHFEASFRVGFGAGQRAGGADLGSVSVRFE